jgi:Zn-dependent protease
MGFFDQSFRVFTLAGITVRVHILFLLWILFRLFQAQGDWQGTLAWMGMLFGIVLLHEFGHCFGARAVGGDAHNIVMWPLGGLAFADAPMRPWPQFVTVACGPLVNVALCILSAAVLIIATGRPEVVSLSPWSPFNIFAMNATWQVYVGLFYHVNLILLYFNLLPIYPLDGGQILWTILWPFTGLQRATVLAAQLGLVGAVLLGMWGLSRPGGGMLIAIAIFGGLTCFQRLQAIRQGAFFLEEFRSYDRVGRYRRGGGLCGAADAGARHAGPPRARGAGAGTLAGWLRTYPKTRVDSYRVAPPAPEGRRNVATGAGRRRRPEPVDPDRVAPPGWSRAARPGGAEECSHGCRPPQAAGTRGPRSRRAARPGGAEEQTSVSAPAPPAPAELPLPLRGRTEQRARSHGLRSAPPSEPLAPSEGPQPAPRADPVLGAPGSDPSEPLAPSEPLRFSAGGASPVATFRGPLGAELRAHPTTSVVWASSPFFRVVG